MKKTHDCSKVFKKCIYSKVLGGVNPICDYLCMTGSSRGCSPDKCDKYKNKEKKNDTTHY